MLKAVAIAAGVGLAAASAPAAASALPAPLPANVSAQGHTVRSVIGSYCVDAEHRGVGVCADASAERPGRRHRLTVAPRMPLRVEFRDQPQLKDDVVAASASLVRFRKDRQPKPGERVEIVRSGDRWTARLPRKLRRANALYIFTRLAGGGDITHVISLRGGHRR